MCVMPQRQRPCGLGEEPTRMAAQDEDEDERGSSLIDPADEHEFTELTRADRQLVPAPNAGHLYRKRVMKGTGTSWAFTEAAKERALERYAQTGIKKAAALAAGVSCETITQHLLRDAAFAEAWEEAAAEFRLSLEMEMHRRGMLGTLEPVIGRVGKDQDGVITYVRRYSDSIALRLAARHMPEWRERSQVDTNVSGGVLVVGAPVSSVEQFMQRHGGPKEIPKLPGEK